MTLFRRITVQLIEDDEVDVRLIERALSQAENIQFTLHHSELLVEGLRQLRQRHVDVLLLDLNLPDSGGIETAARIRSQFPRLPIVVLTGHDEREIGLEAIHAGAQDYLPKGRIDSELLIRSILYAIERRRVEAANRELAAARKVQDRLFPSSPPRVAGFDIAGACRPAYAAGGDYYDYLSRSQGKVDVIIADVSGNGLGPAVVMGEARASIRALARTPMEPAEILQNVHQLLQEDAPSRHFITLFWAHLDSHTRILQYTGAGHEAYLLRKGQQLEALPSTTYPLALELPVSPELSAPILLDSGDILVMMTDGVFEMHNADKEEFGQQRALDVVRDNREAPAEEIVRLVYESALQFAGVQNNHDDTTLVIAKVLSS